jgi:hypothetical protein
MRCLFETRVLASRMLVLSPVYTKFQNILAETQGQMVEHFIATGIVNNFHTS